MPRRFLRIGALAIAATWVTFGAPHDASAQGSMRGIRGGVGMDTTGELAYSAQIEINDFGDGGSAELAIGIFGAGSAERYRRTRNSRVNEYREQTSVAGLGLMANYLFMHSPESRAPYLLLGVGLGALDVDWTIESPGDSAVGPPLPGGGFANTEDGIVLGSMVNVGIGLRLHDNADLRAQALTMLVSSTEAREDLKFIPALTLTAGLGF